MRPIAGPIATILLAAAMSAPARAAEPEWKAAADECRKVLADLVAIDTSNPPGNELAAARYLERLLSGEGIECRVFETAPGRGNLVARLKGDGTRRPLLLLGHLDVVGVDRAKWTSDPFALVERDGYLYGRGAIDDKGMVAAEACVLLHLKRLGVPLARDVILLAEGDEESGGDLGITWMLEKQRAAIEAEYALNEGGRTKLDPATGRVDWVALQTAEKRPVNYTLTATGQSGHASMPRPDNCILALARAIARAADPPFPVRLIPETRAFFAAVGAGDEAARARDLMYDAMQRDTVSPTIVKGGFRSNVIPSSAEATLNVRLLPGSDPEEMRKALVARIADPSVAVTYTPPTREEAPTVPFEGPVVEAVRRAAADVFPGAKVVPILSTGATDSADLRRAGIKAYGLLPFPLATEDAARMHGDDERLPVASLEPGLRLLYRVTVDVAGAGKRGD